MKSYLTNWIWGYGSWIAIALLCVAIFIALIANSIVLPLVPLCVGIGLLGFRYWDAIKTFDFWALDEWTRARMDLIGIREWHSPYHAVEHFCDPKLVHARNEAAGQMNAIMMELIRDRDRNAGIPNDTSPLRRRHGDYEAAQAQRDQFNASLAHDLLRQLVAGNLVAKGMPAQNDITRPERIIPTSRWRVMQLDIAKAEASGRGLHYIGVVVGKKTKR